MRRRIDPDLARDLARRYSAGEVLDDRARIALGRGSLEELAERAPGRSVEIRIPYVGAAQIIEGTRHTRGTPPAVIEMELGVWLDLATGNLSWGDGVAGGKVAASGQRVDISTYLPVWGAL